MKKFYNILSHSITDIRINVNFNGWFYSYISGIPEAFVCMSGMVLSLQDETNTDESDIDILVEFEKPIGWKFFTLELYLERTFGRKVDLVTKSGLKDQINNQILNQLEYV